VAPCCCESFERHILGGVSFSREEHAELLRRLALAPGGHGDAADKPLQGKARERFEEKLRTGNRI
jgi:thymidylate synthase (FAD)